MNSWKVKVDEDSSDDYDGNRSGYEQDSKDDIDGFKVDYFCLTFAYIDCTWFIEKYMQV